jgi:ribosomal protein L11 methyltransferase
MGIEETDGGLRAYFDDTATPETVQRRFTNFAVSVDGVVEPIAVHETGNREPIRVGERFLIVPTELIVLPIDAAMAFGSGRHETTQLCLEALEQCVKPGDTVFDVGCGSGILALAAQKLGAAMVVGADIDEAAISVARRHFSGPLFVGSADGFPDTGADLVICNITAKVNDHIAGDLRRIAKPGGRIVLSGFIAASVPARFQAERVFHLAEWQCWICDPSLVQIGTQEWNTNQHEKQWWL